MTNTALTLFSNDNLESMLAKANVLIASGLVPKKIAKPETVLVACTIGAEYGFSPMQALRVVNVIDGQPSLSAAGMVALCQRSGGQIETVEHDDKKCVLKITRTRFDGKNPQEHVETYTLLDAQKQGLLGKDNWLKMPKQMLYARCVSNALRKLFGDVLAGLYSTEEMTDAVGEGSAPTAAPKAVKTTPKAAAPVLIPDAVVEAEVVPDQADLVRAADAAQNSPVKTVAVEQPPLPVATPVTADAIETALVADEVVNPAKASHADAIAAVYAKHFPDVQYTEATAAKVGRYCVKKGLLVKDLDARFAALKVELEGQ